MSAHSPENTRRHLLIGLGLAGASQFVGPVTIATGQEGGTSMSVLPKAPEEELARQSAANLAVVQRYCAAWLALDRAALGAMYHDEITLHWFGRHPLAGDHVGRAASLRALAEFTRRTSRQLLGIVDVMAGPHRATVISREAFRRDGQRAEIERVLVFALKDGLLHDCWVYDRDPVLVDRFLADA